MKEENNMVSSKIESLTDQMHAFCTLHTVRSFGGFSCIEWVMQTKANSRINKTNKKCVHSVARSSLSFLFNWVSIK